MGAAKLCLGGEVALSKTAVSIVRTQRSIFGIFVLFFRRKFLSLELLPTGPVSSFSDVSDHILHACRICEAAFLPGLPSLEIQLFRFSICSNNCYYF